MTQYQQVIAAVKKLSGKRGTLKQICDAIDDLENWKTKTKENSVYSYLYRGAAFKKDGEYWELKEIEDIDEDDNNNDDVKQGFDNKNDKDGILRGLYFITINPIIKLPIAGLLFKIGKADNVRTRLKNYGASLPFNLIIQQCFYRIPFDVNLSEIEDQVRTELLTNDTLGITIEKYSDSNQIEWLQTLDLFLTEEDINKLAKVVNNVVKDTIDNLRNKDDDSEKSNI